MYCYDIYYGDNNSSLICSLFFFVLRIRYINNDISIMFHYLYYNALMLYVLVFSVLVFYIIVF